MQLPKGRKIFLIQIRENEAAVLKALQSSGGNCSFEELVTSTRQESAAATRALATLQEKQLVSVHETERILLKLTAEGSEYAKLGLPERRIVQAVLELGGEATLEQASRRAGIQPAMSSVALGWIKVTKWCEVTSAQQKILLRQLRAFRTRRTPKSCLKNYPRNPKSH